MLCNIIGLAVDVVVGIVIVIVEVGIGQSDKSGGGEGIGEVCARGIIVMSLIFCHLSVETFSLFLSTPHSP